MRRRQEWASNEMQTGVHNRPFLQTFLMLGANAARPLRQNLADAGHEMITFQINRELIGEGIAANRRWAKGGHE
jgi:hypothetical protein